MDPVKLMTVLVTGGTGLVGRSIEKVALLSFIAVCRLNVLNCTKSFWFIEAGTIMVGERNLTLFIHFDSDVDYSATISSYTAKI